MSEAIFGPNFCGHCGGAYGEHSLGCPNAPRVSVLDIDVDVSYRARAMHRVWRALNDGDCPKCHAMHAATDILRETRIYPLSGEGITCPTCGFKITYVEIAAIELLFAPAMDAAVAVFEEWRAARNDT
jgi:hypothetical protein